jgi:hypothetical protein
MEEFCHLSNAASTHTQHEKSKCQTRFCSEDTLFIDSKDEEKLAALFTEDGTYEFAGKKNTGAKNIIACREQLFKNSPHRDHPVVKVYTFGEEDHELMALGNVDYGKGEIHEWAGRYSIVKDAKGELKFKHAQIILVSTV